MNNYKRWNDQIYRYFFNENTIKNSNFLFNVYKGKIEEIGKNLKIENPIEDFCNCVLDQILESGKIKNKLSIKKLEYNDDFSGDIPKYTAIIAFFIYVASIEDAKEDDKYKKDNEKNKAYWKKFKNLIVEHKNVKKDNLSDNLLNNDEKYKYARSLFTSFSDHICTKFNIDFHFSKIFEREGDFIGLPMSQILINDEDFFNLHTKFKKYTPTNAKNLKIIKEDKPKPYSRAFKRARDGKSEDIKEVLDEKIKSLYEKWEENDKIEYEYNDKVLSEKEVISTFRIRIENSEYEFEKIFKRDSFNKQLEDEDLNKKLENEGYNYNKFVSEYYKDTLKPTLKKDIFDKNGNKIKEEKRRNLILFKEVCDEDEEEYDEDECKIYEEVKSADIGEKVRILFESVNITQIPVCSEKINKLTNNLYITEDYIFNECNDFCHIKSPGTISLKKGLKDGAKDKYLKGAEPILYIKEKPETIKIDEKEVTYPESIPIKIRLKEYNENGKHEINVDNNHKFYWILEEFDENEQEHIYNIYKDGQIIKTDKFEEDKNVINGCIIKNLELKKKNNKADFIEEILEAIYKKQTGNTEILDDYETVFKNGSIAKRYLKELEK